MKLVSAFLLLFIIGCKSSDKKESLNMPGTYNMLSQSVKGDKTDTTYTSLQQLKIYTEDFMMYANVNSPDSASGFGIASYSVNADTVTENVIYNASDSTSDDTLRHFTLIIEKTAKGYKQVIPEIQFGAEKMKLTEDYESAGTAAKSSLDGAWKLVKSYTIKGKDTTNNNAVQYKTYNAGYVIWGNNWSDSMNKKHTGIGFGKFEMTGNKVKESMTASTYSDVRGHDFDIDIELNGTDGFTQTMNNTDGTKSVEVYTRLKK
jgi:hypothetical protein